MIDDLIGWFLIGAAIILFFGLLYLVIVKAPIIILVLAVTIGLGFLVDKGYKAYMGNTND